MKTLLTLITLEFLLLIYQTDSQARYRLKQSQMKNFDDPRKYFDYSGCKTGPVGTKKYCVGDKPNCVVSESCMKLLTVEEEVYKSDKDGRLKLRLYNIWDSVDIRFTLRKYSYKGLEMKCEQTLSKLGNWSCELYINTVTGLRIVHHPLFESPDNLTLLIGKRMHATGHGNIFDVTRVPYTISFDRYNGSKVAILPGFHAKMDFRFCRYTCFGMSALEDDQGLCTIDYSCKMFISTQLLESKSPQRAPLVLLIMVGFAVQTMRVIITDKFSMEKSLEKLVVRCRHDFISATWSLGDSAIDMSDFITDPAIDDDTNRNKMICRVVFSAKMNRTNMKGASHAIDLTAKHYYWLGYRSLEDPVDHMTFRTKEPRSVQPSADSGQSTILIMMVGGAGGFVVFVIFLIFYVRRKNKNHREEFGRRLEEAKEMGKRRRDFRKLMVEHKGSIEKGEMKLEDMKERLRMVEEEEKVNLEAEENAFDLDRDLDLDNSKIEYIEAPQLTGQGIKKVLRIQTNKK